MRPLSNAQAARQDQPACAALRDDVPRHRGGFYHWWALQRTQVRCAVRQAVRGPGLEGSAPALIALVCQRWLQ